MRSQYATLLLLLLRFYVHAQSGIAGKVVDTTSAPVPFAIVALLHVNDSSVVAGTPTDDDGHFEFAAIHPGNYLLKISATGFKEQVI